MAGGCAQNSVANGKIYEHTLFKKIYIQAAAGDAGGAIGAAFNAWNQLTGKRQFVMDHAYWGPHYGDNNFRELLNAHSKTLEEQNCKIVHLKDDKILCQKTAQAIIEGKVVGWFQGKMEFGPRALGARSIIADPRSDKMQKKLNLKVKFRESFRPFAPSILIEDVSNWFDLKCESPYMLLVADVKKELQIQMSKEDQTLFGIDKLNIKRSSIPAVTHVDYSARVQTVHKETNPRYHNLLKKFKEITGCPVLVNTSFNVRGEPIVCSIKDAFNCFMGTNLDILVCENFILYKNDQDDSLKKNYQMEFDPD